MLGRSGTPVASWMMNESDLLLVFGASFSNHTGIADYKPIIQVDFDPMALGSLPPRHRRPCSGDVGRHRPRRSPNGSSRRTERESTSGPTWPSGGRSGGRRRSAALADDRGPGVSSAAVFAAMNRHVPDDAVIAVDVGNNAYSFGRYFECTEQSVLMSGYLGSIGFGFPAAMGAWAAAPDRPIVAVTGDGGFGQYLAELTTAVKYGMDITHVLLNNASLGKISKEQRAVRLRRLADLAAQPGLRRLRRALRCVRACGSPTRPTSTRRSRDALAHDGPALVEVVTDPDLV